MNRENKEQDTANNAVARVTSRDTWPPKWVATAAVPTVQPKAEAKAAPLATAPKQVVQPSRIARQTRDPAYAEPGSDRERVPYWNRLTPDVPDHPLAWEEMIGLPGGEQA
jgi:hypothetical protein